MRIALYAGLCVILSISIWYSVETVASHSSTQSTPEKQSVAEPSSQISNTQPSDSTLATVDVGHKSYTFRSNSIGLYPRISIPPEALIKIHVKANPLEPIQEEVLDGGSLNNQTIFQEQAADDSGNINFRYQTRTSPGSYRVAIYRKGKREIFDFWVETADQSQ